MTPVDDGIVDEVPQDAVPLDVLGPTPVRADKVAELRERVRRWRKPALVEQDR